MKAVRCHRHGPPSSLVVDEVPHLIAEGKDVVVDIHACGVNFPDTLIIQGKYQFQPPLPFTPGSDVSGVVKSIGPGVTKWKVGDPVMAQAGWGGFAEEVCVSEDRLIPLPGSMDMLAGAAFNMVYGTSHYALKGRGNLQPGDTLLVLGAAGGVGLTAVELGKVMGARVIAAASTDEKLEVCKRYGADMVINYTTQDLKKELKRLTNGKGVDVVYDPVGDKWAEPAVRSMAWGGRYLVIGFAGGEIPKLPLNLYLLKSCSVVGVFWGAWLTRDPAGAAASFAELSLWHAQGKIKPLVSQLYTLEEASRALDDMAARRVTGKAVVVTKHYRAPAKL